MMNEKVLDEARKIIAGFLKKRREELGLSEDQLADRTGFKATTIASIENGKFWMSMKQYLVICEALYLFPAIATFEEKSDIADMMRANWTEKPKAMTLKDAITLKKRRHNRDGQQN